MEKSLVSVLLLLVAVSYISAKDTTVKSEKKDVKETRPKLPQTLSRGKGTLAECMGRQGGVAFLTLSQNTRTQDHPMKQNDGRFRTDPSGFAAIRVLD